MGQLHAVFTTLIAREVLRGERPRNCPSTLRFQLKGIVALFDIDVAHVTPELSPAVSDDPVVFTRGGVMVPTHNRDHVVDSRARVGNHAVAVIDENGRSINSTRNRTSCKDFSSHGSSAAHLAELRDGGVGEFLDSDAFPTHGGEGGAGSCSVDWRTGPVGSLAKALSRVRTAGHVGLLSFIRDSSARLGNLLNPRIRAHHRAPHARASIATVQHVLNRKVDVDALALASDLDSIAEGRHGPVRPAASTILRNVLISRGREIIGSIDISPVPLFRKIFRFEIGVWLWLRYLLFSWT